MTEFQSETLTKSNERALQSKYVDILCECMKTVTDNITQVNGNTITDEIDVVFFLDASGSCYAMSEKFLNAVSIMPRPTFKIHLYSFDTQVYELNIDEPKMMGGGGTLLPVMETFIQEQIQSGKMKKYPDAVFVITDGHGDKISPEKPENWFWLMTIKYHTYHSIPKESSKFVLSEFA